MIGQLDKYTGLRLLNLLSTIPYTVFLRSFVYIWHIRESKFRKQLQEVIYQSKKFVMIYLLTIFAIYLSFLNLKNELFKQIYWIKIANIVMSSAPV